MSNVPANLKYVTSHEWVRKDDDGLFTVGITDHAQELLGDIVFVQLPEAGASVAAHGEIGVVEGTEVGHLVLPCFEAPVAMGRRKAMS